MATVAGDEITEAIMKKYLLDFGTAEIVKTQLGSQNSVRVSDILGFEKAIPQDDMLVCIKDSMAYLCREISEQICEVNGGPTSAVFLAGGGSKLAGLRELVAEHMKMDINRVAIAGNNFKTYAFSDTCDINDPEYATPLGIAVSAGLNLITESFQITLNGSRAKLFRNNTMTVLDILMMNGFSYQDFMPRTGQKLIVQINGSQAVFYGTAGEPAVLLLNGLEAKPTNLVHAGDAIDFKPAVHAIPHSFA
jgi:cell division ATPase FtsA